jgi:uncharacterized protein
MNLKLSRYIIFTAAINPDDRPDIQNRILYSTVTNTSVVVKQPVADQLSDGKFDSLDPDLVRQLIRANILVPDDRDEFSAVLTENRVASGQLTSLNVVWDGMEPSVDLPRIIQLSEKYLEQSDRSDIPYKASMVTDGAGLTKEIFETLFYRCAIKNFHITWTPDFSAVFHTIEHILREVPFTPKDGVIFEIRINIDKASQDAPFVLIDRFADLCFQNRVTFQFGPAINTAIGPAIDATIDATINAAINTTTTGPGDAVGFDIKEFAELEFEYLLHAIQKGFIQSILPARTFVACPAVDENSVGAGQYQKGICYGCSLFPSCGGACQLKDDEKESACPPFKYNIEDRVILNYIYQKSGFNNLMASPF